MFIISLLISVTILFLVGRHMYTQLLKNFKKETIIETVKQCFEALKEVILEDEDGILGLIGVTITIVFILLIPIINVLIISFLCGNFYDVIYDGLYEFVEEVDEEEKEKMKGER